MDHMKRIMTMKPETVLVDKYGGAEFRVNELSSLIVSLIQTDTKEAINDFLERFVERLPWWQKPILWSEWKQLEHQALRSCQMTGETYRDAKRTSMPHWFIQRVARNWFRAKRRYFRIKHGNEARMNAGLMNLLAQLACG